MLRKIFVSLSALRALVLSASSVAPVLAVTAIIGVNLVTSVASAEDVVAVVGTKQITTKDLNDKYSEVVKQTINPPTREVFLEDLIRYEMGVQEAMKHNLQDDPIVKEKMRQEVYKALLEKELGKSVAAIKVNEKEMQNYYKVHPELRTSHVLIEFRPDATAEQKKAAHDRAEEIFQEIKKSKRPFEELVGLYTDDVLSKRTGGDVGWQSNLTLVPPYYGAALAMKVGEVRGLIETQYGYHIIKLTGRHGYNDANKPQIRAAVFDEKRKEIFDEYFAKLKKAYPVKINKDKLK